MKDAQVTKSLQMVILKTIFFYSYLTLMIYSYSMKAILVYIILRDVDTYCIFKVHTLATQINTRTYSVEVHVYIFV